MRTSMRMMKERSNARKEAVKMNAEGLTWEEWYNAATCHGAIIPPAVAYKAWEAGEDPTEYANVGKDTICPACKGPCLGH